MGKPVATNLEAELAIARKAFAENRKANEELRKVTKELGDLLRRNRARRRLKK